MPVPMIRRSSSRSSLSLWIVNFTVAGIVGLPLPIADLASGEKATVSPSASSSDTSYSGKNAVPAL